MKPNNTNFMQDGVQDTVQDTVQDDTPEYNFAQLQLLVHALEMLDTSEYSLPNTETHRYLLERFRKQLKEYEK